MNRRQVDALIEYIDTEIDIRAMGRGAESHRERALAREIFLRALGQPTRQEAEVIEQTIHYMDAGHYTAACGMGVLEIAREETWSSDWEYVSCPGCKEHKGIV